MAEGRVVAPSGEGWEADSMRGPSPSTSRPYVMPDGAPPSWLYSLGESNR